VSDPSINVETSELSRFAKDVRFESDEGLNPAIARADAQLPGVRFGQNNASGTVHAAKTRYMQAYLAHLANLNNYVEAGNIMAEAAELVAKEFDAVDARSADAAKRVGQILRTATDEYRRKIAEAEYDDPTTGTVRAI
jgi:hypothetical protein